MTEPRASRPHMPGHGIVGPDEGRGLLPWSWAEQRLVQSHDYWLATVWPDVRPHIMPVWGLWRENTFWFSSGVRARKARNLREDPRCFISTENPVEPVVVEGIAEVVTDPTLIELMVRAINDKYSSDVTVEFMDPEVNATIRVRPTWAFGLVDAEFTETPHPVAVIIDRARYSRPR